MKSLSVSAACRSAASLSSTASGTDGDGDGGTIGVVGDLDVRLTRSVTDGSSTTRIAPIPFAKPPTASRYAGISTRF